MTITLHTFTIELRRTHFYMSLSGWFGLCLSADGLMVDNGKPY